MDAAVHRIATYDSSPIRNRYGRERKLQNVQSRVGLVLLPSMPMIDLSLRSFPAHAIVHRLHDPRILRFAVPKSMADEAKNPKMENPPPKEGEKRGESAPENLPSPPEKPLPGDCCGSGCVRCVWDVYYEELEAYNNLREEGSKQS